jgi:hypothetical protein
VLRSRTVVRVIAIVLLVTGLISLFWAGLDAALLVGVCENQLSIFSPYVRCRWPAIWELVGFIEIGAGILFLIADFMARRWPHRRPKR